MTADFEQRGGLVDPQAAERDDARARAISRLVEEHNRALHAFLMTRVHDEQEARDVAQEAYVRVLQLHQPGAVNFLRAYLFKTAANIAINRARDRRVRRRLESIKESEELVEPLTPEQSVLAAEEVKVLTSALFELPPKSRRAFVLHRFKEWDIDRIAVELGVGARQVRHYLVQAGLYCQLRIRGVSADEARTQVQR